MYKIEQELGTTIRPIPQAIDKRLYVAEYQTDKYIQSDQDIIQVLQIHCLAVYCIDEFLCAGHWYR